MRGGDSGGGGAWTRYGECWGGGGSPGGPRTQSRSCTCPRRRYAHECAQLQGSYPVARWDDGYLLDRATRSHTRTAKQAPVLRSTRRARQKGAKCPFRVLQFCQSKPENAKSRSGRLGGAGDTSAGAARGGGSGAAAPAPLSFLPGKPRAVLCRGYPVATLEVTR